MTPWSVKNAEAPQKPQQTVNGESEIAVHPIDSPQVKDFLAELFANQWTAPSRPSKRCRGKGYNRLLN